MQQEPPKITFPCDYPIKIMGENSADFVSEMVAVVRSHAADLIEQNVNVKASAKGNYLSVTVRIQAQSKQQLDDIFADLKATGRIKMVL